MDKKTSPEGDIALLFLLVAIILSVVVGYYIHRDDRLTEAQELKIDTDATNNYVERLRGR